MSDKWPLVQLGVTFEVDGHQAEISNVCEEPHTGLVAVRVRGWEFTMPAGLVQSHLELAAARQQIADLQENASMACECPCGACPGCDLVEARDFPEGVKRG